jgi:hypothetical protein
MKKIIPLLAPILFLAFACFLIGQALPKSLMNQWEDVESEIKKGLPKTAIEKIDPLIKQALKDGSHAGGYPCNLPEDQFGGSHSGE